MPQKLNCWEFMNCGREHGGLMVPFLGECPIPNAMKFDGQNGGISAGRVCWIAGGAENCLRNNRFQNCHQCPFYKRVMHEQAGEACFKFASIEV